MSIEKLKNLPDGKEVTNKINELVTNENELADKIDNLDTTSKVEIVRYTEDE